MLLHLVSRFKKTLSDRPLVWLIKVTVWCIVLFFVFVILFKYAEKASWEESLWQAWQTFTTVGYGNAPAETTFGRVVTMFTSTLGIAFVGALFSAAFDYKQHLRDKKRLGFMKNTISNGYIVFNFPGESMALSLINELRNVEKEVGVCFVDSRLQELPGSIQQLPNTHFIKGDCLSKSTYENARLNENQAIMVFPFEKNMPESDAATKTIVELVSRFISSDKTRVIYLLVDAANEWMFENVNATQVLADLEILAMVQESQDAHSSAIVENLLLNTKGANPQTLKPTKVVGWTWGELASKCIEVSEKINQPCNLLAIIHNGQCDSCPDYSTKIEEGDLLSLITYETFDWEKFEGELVK